MATQFEDTIKNYLDGRAKEDSLFAETYKKENKSIEECCKYIMQQAQKMYNKRVNGGIAIDRKTVYGWAVHYYDEDDIKLEGKLERVEVAAPSTIQNPISKEKPVQKKTKERKQSRNGKRYLNQDNCHYLICNYDQKEFK